MLSEKNKKTITLALVLPSFILNIMFAIPIGSLADTWYDIRLYYWGWAPAIILPSVIIVIIISLKLKSKTLRGFALFLSILALIIGILWFSLLFIVGHIKP
jgi:hypothetical protein